MLLYQKHNIWFQESNSVPSKKIKTDNNNSAHPDPTSQQQQQQMLNSNHQEKEDSEPPVDFSTTNSTKTLRKQDSGERSPNREEMLPVKSEPLEGTGGGGGCEPDDSNESTVISEPQIMTTEPDDSALVPSVGVQNYFDSKLFAVAGASFNFSMAAALAADSLAGSSDRALK